MATEPLVVDGIAEPLTLRPGWWKTRLYAGETEVPVKRGRFTLARTDGSQAEGRFAAGFEAHPKLKIDGVVHRTGPATPVTLQVLALLPLLLLAVGGALGGACGGAAVVANLAAIRAGRPTVVTVLAMLGISVLALVAYLVLAALLLGALS